MAKLIISPRAQRELAAIGDWIARDNPLRARTFVDEIKQACDKILDAPLGYPVIGRSGGREIRKKVFSPYLILYNVKGQTIRIVAIVHGARMMRPV